MPGKDIDFQKNEDSSTQKTSAKDSIALPLSETLQNEQIVTSFTVNKKTGSIIVGLNHKYEKKNCGVFCV